MQQLLVLMTPQDKDSDRLSSKFSPVIVTLCVQDSDSINMSSIRSRKLWALAAPSWASCGGISISHHAAHVAFAEQASLVVSRSQSSVHYMLAVSVHDIMLQHGVFADT